MFISSALLGGKPPPYYQWLYVCVNRWVYVDLVITIIRTGDPAQMPSKSVSLSDEHYTRLINSQPENMNFSEWCETLQSEALDTRDNEQSSNQTTNEVN